MKSEYSELLESIPPSGIRKFFDLVMNGKDILSLGVGEPDYVTPWSICEEAIHHIEKGYTSYTSNKGLLELRESISEFLAERYAAHYDPENEIIITVGVSEGMDITLRALLNIGDEVIIPEPCYVSYSPLVKLSNGIPISLNTEQTHFIPDPKKLEALITEKTKAILLCSPNNPTGAVIPRKTLSAIASLAKKYNLWVLSDEIYADLSYDDPYTSFSSLPGMHGRTVLLSGFSKGFAMTGWRLGYLCGPKELVQRALKIHQYSALCAPIMSQFAAIEALKSIDSFQPEMKSSFMARRNFIVNKLNKIGLSTELPTGAFYCFPSIKSTGLTSEEFALKLLDQEKVAVVPGSVFGEGGEGYIRCCYAASMEVLKECCVRIQRFIHNNK